MFDFFPCISFLKESLAPEWIGIENHKYLITIELCQILVGSCDLTKFFICIGYQRNVYIPSIGNIRYYFLKKAPIN